MKRLRFIPAIHFLKKDKRYLKLVQKAGLNDDVLTQMLKEQVAFVRKQIMQNEIDDQFINERDLTTIILEKLTTAIDELNRNKLQKVINGTGVVLHTNLGRAPLSRDAVKQLKEVAENYSTLEYDVKVGERGSRHMIVEDYLTRLTGAEAAIVVNNNAACVYFILKAFAKGKEAIISRGELVEIGGSFRISTIMEESDVKVVEVGTTNKTNVADYEQNITDETALILKIHKSNFKMIGFTEEVETQALRPLAKKYNVPIYEDLGSGTLFNFKECEIGNEPTVFEKVNEGIDLISFSGDKLLGGPQAGVIVGKKKYIDRLKKHPLARVLRVDKFTLATLEATLKSYLYKNAQNDIPIVRDLTMPLSLIQEKADRFIEKLTQALTEFTYTVARDFSKVGGGTMPEVTIKTVVVQIKHNNYPSEKIAERLRHYDIPIITRIKNEYVVIDFRTVKNEEMNVIVEALTQMEGEK